ncbi:hypothetical protein KAI87_01535, partial [Myxococcota bacterium]|nr:hypothetical protein [Myxococcota bacterium]
GGRKPIVGWVVPAGDSMLALRDGDGEPILLNLSPRAIRHLKSRLGAKIWVAGKSLVSGQYKVQRYGILRDPPKLEKKKGDPGCPIKETCKPGT